MSTLTGKVAFVTGAASGIGNAIATRLAADGAVVALADLNADGVEAAASALAETGAETLALTVDVSDPASVEAGIAKVVETYGRLDLAVNNAGLAAPPTPLHELSVEAFDRTIAVDLRGVFLTMKAEIPAMLAGGGGVIVNMASGAGLKNAPDMPDYTAAKHGVVGLTKNAALTYARRGIRINAVAPGTVATPGILSLPVELQERNAALIPLGRMAQPSEIADATVWLLSEQSSFVTGAILSVDGGFLYN
jgi:NAD(P)-dependent dehydrogenase (short-subunit alcohol dehydrogenase family)